MENKKVLVTGGGRGIGRAIALSFAKKGFDVALVARTKSEIDLVSDDDQTFNILTLRSFGDSFYHHLTDSALEFGYVGV